MKELLVLLPHLDITDCATLLPIDVMNPQELLMMQLNNPPEIKLRCGERPLFLKVIEEQNNLATFQR